MYVTFTPSAIKSTLRALRQDADRLWDANSGQGYNQPSRSAQVNSERKLALHGCCRAAIAFDAMRRIDCALQPA